MVGLSKIGRAEKEVQIWEAVLEAHKADTIPDLVPLCEAKLQAAKEKRAKLEDCEENHRVGIPQAYPGEIAIAQRIEGLEWGLSTCKFASEEENIRAAIRGYRSGEIGFNEHYTLIYAGRIVDTANSYMEFVNDRNERLDRYAEAHGHHWLWFEPPLNVHPETMPTAMASCALPREDEWTSLGPYHVNQGFWKREGWVARMPALRFAAPPPEMFLIDPQGRVDAGNPGPKLTFRSLLDSGATFPSLHTEDLVNLGIDANFYAAQSIQRMSTANGIIHSRIYEMLVCVLDDAGKHLVDPNNAMWPDFQKYLGGLCPVMESANPLMYDQNGIEVPNRLSGLLPFLACYISSTPTRNMLFLGEDRNDVLGGHRMPGQRKWDIAMPNGPPAAVGQWNRYDDPKITFNHRQGAIMDEDDPDPNVKFRSTITVMRGHPNEREEIVDSRRDTQLLRQAFINANDPWAHLRAGKFHLDTLLEPDLTLPKAVQCGVEMIFSSCLITHRGIPAGIHWPLEIIYFPLEHKILKLERKRRLEIFLEPYLLIMEL